jgi:hypothetical protein
VLNRERQSRKIFVEMHLKNIAKGAEHRNILIFEPASVILTAIAVNVFTFHYF